MCLGPKCEMHFGFGSRTYTARKHVDMQETQEKSSSNTQKEEEKLFSSVIVGF